MATDTTDETSTDDDRGEGTEKDPAALKRALEAERQLRRDAERDARRARQALDDAKKPASGAGEKSDKTGLEALEERLAAAERRAEEAELKSLRAEIAAEKGLTPRQAKRLVGKTRQELEDDADDLVEDLGLSKSNGKGKSKSEGGSETDADGKGSEDDDDAGDGSETETGKGKGRPKEKLRSGFAGESETDGKSPDELAAEVWKRNHGGL